MIRLKIERRRRRWSQAELARRAWLNANTISLIESGRWIPYDVQLHKLASALGLPQSQAHSLLHHDAATE